MMAGYYAAGVVPRATFELYVRALPPNRSFLVAAGLEQALDYLEQVRFTGRGHRASAHRSGPSGSAPQDFFNRVLPAFRFTGDVWAVEEGTPVFPPAPLLRVTAPLPEAQFVETALLAHLGFQTSVASRRRESRHGGIGTGGRRIRRPSRARRRSGCAGRAGGISRRLCVDFQRRGWPSIRNSRVRDDGAFVGDVVPDGDRGASVSSRRCTATKRCSSSIRTTRCRPRVRSWPKACARDRREARQRRLAGAQRACPRRFWTRAGFADTQIFASGDLDEWRVREIVSAGAPIDGFGVGAALSTVERRPVARRGLQARRNRPARSHRRR